MFIVARQEFTNQASLFFYNKNNKFCLIYESVLLDFKDELFKELKR